MSWGPNIENRRAAGLRRLKIPTDQFQPNAQLILLAFYCQNITCVSYIIYARYLTNILNANLKVALSCSLFARHISLNLGDRLLDKPCISTSLRFPPKSQLSNVFAIFITWHKPLELYFLSVDIFTFALLYCKLKSPSSSLVVGSYHPPYSVNDMSSILYWTFQIYLHSFAKFIVACI